MLTKPLALAVGLVAAFGLPGVRHVLPKRFAAADSFPISTFPMFTLRRPAEHRMTWVRALDRSGASLGPLHSGHFNFGGMNQALAHLKQARPKEPARRSAICREIAERVGGFAELRNVARIEIVDAYYRPEKVFGPARNDSPERHTVLVRCNVERARAR